MVLHLIFCAAASCVVMPTKKAKATKTVKVNKNFFIFSPFFRFLPYFQLFFPLFSWASPPPGSRAKNFFSPIQDKKDRIRERNFCSKDNKTSNPPAKEPFPYCSICNVFRNSFVINLYQRK
jgi:hypothetical protein